MADIAISYAHCDVDDAIALRASLLAIGCTVWMDDPGENADASSTGIPVGRAHWEVIEKELAAALQIVVIDRLEWRTREYCQKEYRLCQSLGKSIILLTPNDLVTAAPQISATIAANERVLAAHARLASRALSPRERHSWLQRIVFQRAAHDAELVTTAHPGAGVEMTPLLREVAEEEIRTAQNTRRRLRSIGTQIVSGLLVLAVLAGIAWRLSSGWSREAVSAERAAEALELASQSSTAVDTVRGVSLAEQAVKHDPSPLIHQARSV